MSDTVTPVTIHLTDACIEAVHAWITRSKEPDQTLEEAIAHLLAKGVGADAEQTVIPPLVTGRDIV